MLGCLNKIPLIKRVISSDVFHKKHKIDNKGKGKYCLNITGDNHLIIIGKGTFLDHVEFVIHGHNNTITIGENCIIRKNCSFWMEGNNISIKIGNNTTFNHTCHFCIQEANSEVVIGNDCMLANRITFRTSDSHPIYDIHTNKRLNCPKNIFVGDHVWIAPESKIFKGAQIQNGAIIGTCTLVNKLIPENCLAVGMPARIVKENVKWTREDIIYSNPL